MKEKELTMQEQIANMTGLKKWKVQLVFAKKPLNLHRVTDDEMAIILHAAAELGYENRGKFWAKGIKQKEVTIEMVAKRAGVSDSTVAYAFRKNVSTGMISQETRAHVLKIAKELGYKPTFERNLKNFIAGKIENFKK